MKNKHPQTDRQTRKMFDFISHSVVKPKRTQIGHIKDNKIPVGAYCEMDEDEIKCSETSKKFRREIIYLSPNNPNN